MARNFIKLPVGELTLILKGDMQIIEKYKNILFPICKLCGSTFTAKRTDQRCCSKECMRKLFEKENLEKRSEYKKTWAQRKRDNIDNYNNGG